MEKISGQWGEGPSADVRGELCIREPEDVLAFVPHTMGEWPRESLVAVAIGAGTVGVTVRVDLPAPGPGADREGFAEAVRDHLVTDRLADSSVLVVYTAEPWTDPATPPWIELVAMLGDTLAAAGVPVLDAWLVGEEHWRSLLCGDESCCPWPGHPVEAIESSRLGAEMVYRGSSFDDSARRAPSQVLQKVERPRAATSALVDHFRGEPDAWWDAGTFASALVAWEQTLADAEPPSPERLGLLASSLGRPALRDAVLVGAALGTCIAWKGSVALRAVNPDELSTIPDLPGAPPASSVGAAVRAWESGGCVDGDGDATDAVLSFGAVLLGGTRDRPDWNRIDRLERALRRLSAMEEPEVRAPVLALLGWICWVGGRGSKASGFLRRSLSAVPGYRFAELFARIVETGEIAGWARRPETAWRRIEDAAEDAA